MKTALIIGGGFTGCASAHLLSQLGGWDITLLEAAPFLGAGNRTQFYGGHPYTFGPRHFLTQDVKIYEYLNAIVPLRSCANHEFVTYVEQDEQFYSYPIHRDDIPTMPDAPQIQQELNALNLQGLARLSEDERSKLDDAAFRRLNIAADAKDFEEYWIYSIGRTLYDKFVDTYSKKMWQVEDNKLIDDFSWSPKGVNIKEGGRAAWNTAISGYPVAYNGYDDYFRISTADVNVRLSTRAEAYDIPAREVVIEGERQKFDVIINTISPDILFDFSHGELPYVGRDLLPIVLPVEHALPDNTFFVYYAGNEPFTRMVEYKKFTLHKAPTTLVTLEIPSARNKHYPLPMESEKAKAQKYFDEMPDEVFSIGRAGSYHYNVDIDDAIDHAFKTVDALTS